MSTFSRLIKFVALEDNKTYFADAGASGSIEAGNKYDGCSSVEALNTSSVEKKVTVSQLLAPTPTSNPIYCVGLNYVPHAKESGTPPIWLKPAGTWANPGEAIPLSKWTSENFPDYESELVFITSKDAKDVSVVDADDYIFGYIIGNDLTARIHQDPHRISWQFGHSKGFVKFAPIGPYLVPPSNFSIKETTVQTKLNGVLKQDSPIHLIFNPAAILSFISLRKFLT